MVIHRTFPNLIKFSDNLSLDLCKTDDLVNLSSWISWQHAGQTIDKLDGETGQTCLQQEGEKISLGGAYDPANPLNPEGGNNLYAGPLSPNW